MKLRNRIVMAASVTLLVASVGSYLGSSAPVRASIQTFEERDVRERVISVEKSLKNRIGEVHRISSDWAVGQRAAEYFGGRSPHYLREKFASEIKRDIKIDYAGFFSKDLKLVESMRQQNKRDAWTMSDSEARRLIERLVRSEKSKTISTGVGGIVSVGGEPVAISIRPVQKVSGKTAQLGWLIICEHVDLRTILDVRDLTRQSFSLQSAVDERYSTHVRALRSSSTYLGNSNPLEHYGYCLLWDIYGKPGFIIKTAVPRSISKQGEDAIWSSTLHLFAISSLFAIVMLMVVERTALARIQTLSQQVASVDDFLGGGRVDEAGEDEVTSLAKQINLMLDKLESSGVALKQNQETLKAQNENLEVIVAERTRAIEYQASHDKLTGLPNRALFLERLTHALTRARLNESCTAVMFIDLDNFKIINDSLGHDAGDELLIAVSKLLVSSINASDTVARLGGDEFTILLENVNSPADAEKVAERILAKLRKPIMLGSTETYAGASIGIAVSSDGLIDEADLLKNADTAMYRAKAHGKSGSVTFDESMLQHVLVRLEIETALRSAILNREIEVHYQPLYDLQKGCIVGCEALARWNHPARGNISPAIFIPIAEDSGIIVDLGYTILQQACRQAKMWVDEGAIHDFVMSVNLSGKQIQRANVVERVQQVLEETQLDPKYLKLEITETVLLEDKEDAIQKMNGLKQLGIHLALDDFGTGYSSLSTLRAFPIDTLKIDRSFIQRVTEERDARAIVEAILVMAKSMGLNVCGEGVETEEQAQLIAELGCSVAQGFLYSQALRPGVFRALLSEAERGNPQAFRNAA